jgi:hypothetical protein
VPGTHSNPQMSLPADVREPNEVALGSIPSSVNLPLSTFEKNLSMDEGAFLLAFSGVRGGRSSYVEPCLVYRVGDED